MTPIRALLLAAALCGAAIAPCRAQEMTPVAPETRFELPLLALRSPAGQGWLTIDAGADGRFFMRRASSVMPRSRRQRCSFRCSRAWIGRASRP